MSYRYNLTSLPNVLSYSGQSPWYDGISGCFNILFSIKSAFHLNQIDGNFKYTNIHFFFFLRS